jgi:uncharacterized protein (TIGR03067 family)
MTRRLLPITLALTLAAAPLAAQAPRTQGAKAAPAAKPSALMASLQGVWQMINANGQDAAGSGQEITITITDNKYVQTVNGQVVERGTFTLDERKKPMTIDITIVEGDNAGQTQLGVVEIADKTMTGKLGEPGVATRPTDFAVAEGTFTFKMVKK